MTRDTFYRGGRTCNSQALLLWIYYIQVVTRSKSYFHNPFGKHSKLRAWVSFIWYFHDTWMNTLKKTMYIFHMLCLTTGIKHSIFMLTFCAFSSLCSNNQIQPRIVCKPLSQKFIFFPFRFPRQLSKSKYNPLILCYTKFILSYFVLISFWGLVRLGKWEFQLHGS